MTIDEQSLDIAVIGISCRFPGAENYHQFWDNIKNGKESIIDLSELELQASGIDPLEYKQENYIRRASVLKDFDAFDAYLFNFSEQEAVLLDPQHRVFLEVAREALEDSGFNFNDNNRSVGVYAGTLINSYLLNNIMNKNQHFGLDISEILEPLLASDKDYLATRVSYKLNLTGPSVAIQSACSTSLVAVHTACQSLLNFECDMALAGAISIRVPHYAGYSYVEDSIASKDGHCRPFDASASGTVFGSGVGVIILKRLDAAIQDHDQIYAVIKGAAINNDGASKVSYTAPSIDGQTAVVCQALDVSGVNPETIEYIETHGTGTQLGDPIEVFALKSAYNKYTNKKKYCQLGSVKANIGHLDTAAGMAGIIKVILALKYKLKPPSVNYTQPNSKLNLNETPFYISTELLPWQASPGNPRRAAVTALGVGGTNAHVILEEAPVLRIKNSNDSESLDIFTFAAKNQQALFDLMVKNIKYFQDNPDINFRNACYTANLGREHLKFRKYIVASSPSNAIEEIKQLVDKVEMFPTNINIDKIAFLFTGQGSQYYGMGKSLYLHNEVFKTVIEDCEKILSQTEHFSLKNVLWGEDSSLINNTLYTQPALFSLEYALYQMWRVLGVNPDVLVGHSLGEYVAACVSGIFDLETALQLVAQRAKLMNAITIAGSMVSVNATQDIVTQLIAPFKDYVNIAVINSDENIVISGRLDEIGKILRILESKNIRHKRLNVSHAFHSQIMNEISSDFMSLLAAVKFNIPKIKIINNLDGSDDPVIMSNPGYWLKQTLHTIDFNSCVHTLLSQNYTHVLEIGPDPVLGSLISDSAAMKDKKIFLFPSMQSKTDENLQFNRTLGDLYVSGLDILWSQLYITDKPFKISLPTYAYQHEKYWYQGSSYKDCQYNDNNALLGTLINSPALPAKIVYQNYLASESLAYFRDHCVYGYNIIPASAYISMALSVANKIFSGAIEIQNLVFNRALIKLQEKEQSMQFIGSYSDNNKQMNFEIFSVLESDAINSIFWELNVSGDFLVSPSQDYLKQYVPQVAEYLKLQTTSAIDPQNLYSTGKKIGFEWGGDFQCVKKIWRRDNQCLGFIELEPHLNDLKHPYQLHPALLDACFQIFLLSLTTNIEELYKHDLYLPIAVDYVWFAGGCHSEVYSYFIMKTANPLESESFVGDFVLFDENSKLIAVFNGFHFKKTRRESLGLINVSDRKTEYVIKPQAYTLSTSKNESNKWFVAGFKSDLAVNVISKLGVENYISEDIDKFIDKNVSTDNPNVFGVLYFVEELNEYLEPKFIAKQCLDLQLFMQYLISAVAKANGDLKVKLWIISTGSQISTSALCGMAETFALEHPELFSGVIMVSSPVMDSAINNIISLIRSKSDPDQYLLHNDTVQVNRLLQVSPSLLKTRSAKIISDATYIVTGGFGGLGSIAVLWLIEQGAKSIAILSRNAQSDALSQLLAAITIDGVNLKAFNLDVADPEMVQSTLNDIRSTMPAIHGVIHAAGVISDALVMNQTPESLDKALAAKMYGAWNLHQNTLKDPIDLFIMYSSVAAVFGSIGQINYAAANAYLDSLAYYRARKDLVATSINWGPWSEVGMSNRLLQEGISQQFVDALGTVTPKLGRFILDECLKYEFIQVLVLPKADHLDKQGRLKLVDDVNQNYSDQAPSQNTSFGYNKKLFADKTVAEQQEIVKKVLLDILSKILGKKDFVNSEFNTPLRDMGLDSLRSIQARNLLNTAFEQKLHATIFFDYPTIDLILKYLEHTVLPNTPSTTNKNLDDLSVEELAKIIEDQVDSWNNQKDKL
jgi:acyl transferase domain-containing protein